MSKADVKFPSAPDTSAIDIQDEGSVIVINPTALNFTGPGVTVTENPSGTAEVDIPGLQYWTESEDAATQQSTIFTPNNSATDVNAVLLPKGNGANLAQKPDGTTTGGNARGQYATDWQKRRTNAINVASGNDSTLSGGRNNTASGNDSTISGGQNNTASGTGSTVIGGRSCTASGIYSVCGTDQSAASGNQSICIGSESQATANQSTMIGRRGQAVAANSAIFGGEGNRVEGLYSFAEGGGALIKTAYQRAHAAGFQASGNAQISGFSGRAQEGCIILGYNSRLTGGANPPQLQASASTFTLTPGNGTNTGSTLAWRPATADQQFTFQIKLMATVTAISGTATGVNVGDVKQWTFEGSGKIVASTLTILNAGTTPVVLFEDTGLSTMSAQFIVGTSNSVGVEITNATFVGGGDLELMVNGFLYYQEAALN